MGSRGKVEMEGRRVVGKGRKTEEKERKRDEGVL